MLPGHICLDQIQPNYMSCRTRSDPTTCTVVHPFVVDWIWANLGKMGNQDKITREINIFRCLRLLVDSTSPYKSRNDVSGCFRSECEPSDTDFLRKNYQKSLKNLQISFKSLQIHPNRSKSLPKPGFRLKITMFQVLELSRAF